MDEVSKVRTRYVYTQHTQLSDLNQHVDPKYTLGWAWAAGSCVVGGLDEVHVCISAHVNNLCICGDTWACVCACVWVYTHVHAPVHEHVHMRELLYLRECRVHGCVCVYARSCPGAGCYSEKTPCSSCYSRVPPFLIWELKIACVQPCPSGQEADRQPHRAP